MKAGSNPVRPLEDAHAEITIPRPTPPEFGTLTELAPGLFWARMPLPFRLDHVNVYLIEDDDGVAIVDCGMNTPETKALWQSILANDLAGKSVTRIVVTHAHRDHVGAAGWLVDYTGARLVMTETEYLLALLRQHGGFEEISGDERAFYRRGGLTEPVIESFFASGLKKSEELAPLPRTYDRLRAGAMLRIGRYDFKILTGEGHSDDQAMLYARADGIFLCADQVMLGITPNVAVWPMEPDAPALARYIGSLDALRFEIDDAALVCPGHKLPFRGVQRRITELLAHHERFSASIVALCAASPRAVAELVPDLFRPGLDPFNTVLAFVETAAHVGHLLETGRLTQVNGSEDTIRMSAR